VWNEQSEIGTYNLAVKYGKGLDYSDLCLSIESFRHEAQTCGIGNSFRFAS